MIFVTVGTQLPFSRLIDAMDILAPELGEPIFAQTLTSERWARLETTHRLLDEAFEQKCAEARCIVGHAGIGTYLTACRHKKPAILMPRRHRLGEHRSDHQLDTAAVLSNRVGVQVVHSLDDLRTAIQGIGPAARHAPTGYETLLSELAEIVG